MKRVLLVFGTRPEAVKMCPLALELRRRGAVRPVVCATGQHRRLLRDVLEIFQVTPDYDLALMEREQSLEGLTAACLTALGPVLEKESPDLVLVHGDTTTALAAAMAAFYRHIPVGHVEAGLRTGDLAAPFPEEFNRRTVDMVSQYAFAPTAEARENLLGEGFPGSRIWVTGNTGIDALQYTLRQDCTDPALDFLAGGVPVVLTLHRRESLGRPMEETLAAVRTLAADMPGLRILCPVHPNPQVRKTVYAALAGQENIRLTEPMDTVTFHHALAGARLILTDSGGVQEEAAALGVPALVLREKTERPEGIQAGGLLLAGRGREAVYTQCRRLLEEESAWQAMRNRPNPYGDGHASRRIAEVLEQF
ncbi:MAG: UDP-N-acetylglucosamine 2-epimerase (non-hydrolyzing) [Oscillospiraceae bacterium]|nr:UDP-N-acetylglucosamine 2-epimerase (non-hydrolyzing) [Oscillospiraceae bacterium]